MKIKGENVQNGHIKKNIDYLMNTKNWWGPLLFILIISLAGVGMIGYQTYNDAPPMTGFTTKSGEVLVDQSTIERGQIVFHKYALMEYGSFFGDGAQRGPDFTAEALHLVNVYMNEYYQVQFESLQHRQPTENEKQVINEKVKQELKANTYDEIVNTVVLNDAYEFALRRLKKYYLNVFTANDSESPFSLPNYITDHQEIEDLSSFFFWGAWVCVTERPGDNFSYTHN